MTSTQILNKFGIQLQRQRHIIKNGEEEIQACCPFHTDKQPSFYLHEQGLYYYCFGCQASGRIFDVIEAMAGIPRNKVKEMLKGQIPVPTNLQIQQRKQIRDRVPNDNELDVLSYYAHGLHRMLSLQIDHGLPNKAQQGIPKYHDASLWLDYLRNKRGFSDDTIKHFNLGGNANWNKVKLWEMLVDYQHPRLRKEWRQTLYDLRLIRKGGKDYWWKPVIVIPWRYSGQTYYMNARMINPNKKEPRYIGMSGIIKSVFFNDDALDEFDEVYLVEGEFNAIALYENGYPNVVSFGAKNVLAGKGQRTDRLLERLHGKKVILYVDTDRGDPLWEARTKIVSKLNAVCKSVRIIELPLGVDINDYFHQMSRRAGSSQKRTKTEMNGLARSSWERRIVANSTKVPSPFVAMPKRRSQPSQTVLSLKDAQFRCKTEMMHIGLNFPAYSGERILNCYPVGVGKTTQTAEVLTEVRTTALVLCGQHYVADLYSELLAPLRAMRLYGRSHDKIACPYAKKSEELGSIGQSMYFKLKYCDTCEKYDGSEGESCVSETSHTSCNQDNSLRSCLHILQQKNAKHERTLIGMHAHASMIGFLTDNAYGNAARKLIIVDELAPLTRTIYIDEKSLLDQVEILTSVGLHLSGDRIGERNTEPEGEVALQLAETCRLLHKTLMAERSYRWQTDGAIDNHTLYVIERGIAIQLLSDKTLKIPRLILKEIAYAYNNKIPLEYDAETHSFRYSWQAKFSKDSTVIFLSATTPKEYLEKSLDLKIDRVIGDDMYVNRDNLHIAQLLSVTGGRDKVLRDTSFQANLKRFFALACDKHKDQKICVLTSLNDRGDGTAFKKDVMKLLQNATPENRQFYPVSAKDLEKGKLPKSPRWIPVFHHGILGTNLFKDFDVLVEINAHFFNNKDVKKGVREAFGKEVDLSDKQKQSITFKAMIDGEIVGYPSARFIHPCPDVELYLCAQEKAVLIQGEGRLLRGEDVPKVIYRLHNVNIQPYPGAVYPSWKSLFLREFGFADLKGRTKEAWDWILEHANKERFACSQIAEGLGCDTRNIRRYAIKTLLSLNKIKKLPAEAGSEQIYAVVWDA